MYRSDDDCKDGLKVGMTQISVSQSKQHLVLNTIEKISGKVLEL